MSWRQACVMLQSQLSLLERRPDREELDEIISAPLFTYQILKHAETLAIGSADSPLAQYALFAGDTDRLGNAAVEDPRIFYNVSTPSSVFICGSQGSGKSHTLSCMLENCLLPSPILGCLKSPLTGIVFHYDTFISDSGGAPCEAAYLASDSRVKVRVLCPPTNISTIRETYSRLNNVVVEELRLEESHLNTKRMLELIVKMGLRHILIHVTDCYRGMTLMAFGERSQPLYMHVIQRILRDMSITQQKTRSSFKYTDFVGKLMTENLMPDQMRPLQQRLDTLQSFMVHDQIHAWGSSSRQAKSTGTNWTPKAGELIIVDLSCPCVTATMACSLFNICLSIFLEQDASIGRVIALDEAHKYMGDTLECETLTNNLLSAIRLQRHIGARIIISTQEPTISTKLLDLCSVTIVHRFSSPDWLRVLTKHLAGISTMAKVARKFESMHQDDEQREKNEDPTGTYGIGVSSDDPILELFSQIVKLKTGEALVFAPSAILSLEKDDQGRKVRETHKRQAHHVLRVAVRSRVTMDGGQSIMAG